MGGGLGLGSINRIVKELDRKLSNIQIIAVAGRNERLEVKLKNLDTKNLLVVYGFANNMHELIEVSDLVITKPGGVTTAEVLSREKPLIIFSPIPGQESDNAEFLLNSGVAATTSDVGKIPPLINQILNHEVRIESMKKLSSCLKKPYSAVDMVNFVTKTYKK
ncbi:Processive diacylglycerol beta-glucosyltransferase [bioreactor metagenome]|uniref:Processive diacylglycerol beta-glucosyltransferase n=2 Tax=root TaxID=1 RepID=A0A645DIL2_9ZZZZ